MATKEYELAVDVFHQPTNKPGEPFTYKTYGKGDKVPLDAERARELIDAGAIVDPAAKSDTQDGKPGPSQAPKDSKAGTGGTRPSGSGSEVVPLTAEAVAKLKGDDLKGALSARDLSTDGTEKEQRDRLIAAL